MCVTHPEKLKGFATHHLIPNSKKGVHDMDAIVIFLESVAYSDIPLIQCVMLKGFSCPQALYPCTNASCELEVIPEIRIAQESNEHIYCVHLFGQFR